jgi:heterodisulfide reductase subunit B
MRYAYYPGCSLEATAQEYNLSTQAVTRELGLELEELADWNCCGASAAEITSQLLSFVLPARNLALAEAACEGATNGDCQLVASCSACYVNLSKVGVHVKQDPALLDRINQALSVDGLVYSGQIRVRHLLDVLVNDVGTEAIAARVKQPLTGLDVAPYYGCQTVRPYSPFDAPYLPNSMDRILEALGARVHPNPLKAACCGGTLLTTKREVGLKLVGDLFQAVEGADCIVTVCPLCQMNLESYQGPVSKKLGQAVHMPILYLTQLLGLAFGLSERELGLKHNIVPLEWTRRPDRSATEGRTETYQV